MAQTAASLTADQEAQADEQRTKRVFVGLFASAIGADQNYLSDDSNPVGNNERQFIIANPDGSFSQQGRSVSNQQNGLTLPAFTITPMMIALAGLAFTLLREG